jgi:hypothetical protein
MKRKRLYRWLNKGGLYDGPTGLVRNGEEFQAYDSQIPQGFRDTIECLGEVTVEEAAINPPASIQTEEPPTAEVEEDATPAEPLYAVSARGGGWYDVINTQTGEAVSEVAVRLSAAEAIIEELTNE